MSIKIHLYVYPLYRLFHLLKLFFLPRIDKIANNCRKSRKIANKFPILDTDTWQRVTTHSKVMHQLKVLQYV